MDHSVPPKQHLISEVPRCQEEQEEPCQGELKTLEVLSRLKLFFFFSDGRDL